MDKFKNIQEVIASVEVDAAKFYDGAMQLQVTVCVRLCKILKFWPRKSGLR